MKSYTKYTNEKYVKNKKENIIIIIIIYKFISFSFYEFNREKESKITPRTTFSVTFFIADNMVYSFNSFNVVG